MQQAKSKKPTFWSSGIQFECQGSGKCCVSRGQYGYIYLTLNDRKRFAKFLKISTLSFTRKYCSKTDGYFHLKISKNENCMFLDAKRCSAYEARPTQCRTWPFWPENMNVKVWEKEVKAFCPGIGKGKLYSKEDIEQLLHLDPVDS